MPDSSASAPAEVFDSTIGASTGALSQVGLPGPETTETPIHAGMVNGVDPYFNSQYIALSQFTWSTAQDPATLLFSQPIHPQSSHQWIRHLSAMYNTFGGGFDFAFKVAGTGFHAGGIIFVRLPPNIKPESLRTLADITAFEYKIMDPKTLEVEINSIMDQRNIMYHWLGGFDVNDPQTFGGFIAAYVLLPLNTSSTGATTIQVQVWTKPSPNFMFAQIKPLISEKTNLTHDTGRLLERALDFAHFPMLKGDPKTMRVYATTIVPYSDSEVITGAGDFYNSKSIGDFSGVRMDTHMKPPLTVNYAYIDGSLDSSTLVKTKFGIKNTKPDATTVELKFKVQRFSDNKLNLHYKPNDIALLNIHLKAKSDNKRIMIQFHTEEYKIDPSTGNITMVIDPQDFKGNSRYDTCFNADEVPVQGWNVDAPLFKDIAKYADGISFTMGNPGSRALGLQNTIARFVPPLVSEQLVMFFGGTNAFQPSGVSEVFKNEDGNQFLHPGEAVFFELYDNTAGLPIGKYKLYYEGFMTTKKPETNLIFDLSRGRYRFNFLNKAPGTTPLFAIGDQKYTRNYAYSRMIDNF